MLVNNVDIKIFKARLMSRNINNAEVEIFNHWGTNNLNPIFYKKGINKFKVLNITLDIVCNNSNELETMKSNLTKQFETATIKFEDIEYYYRGFISGEPSCKYISVSNETLDISLLVIAEKPQITEVMNRITTKTINVQGNSETPAIVEITPSIDIIDIVLTGLSDDPMTVRNLKAAQKVIFDGENGTVTQNGVNKFLDTDLWEFPRLKSGNNTITVNRGNVDINIKYKPRWI